MLITIFTDISYDPKLGVAAWAAWGKINGQTFRHSALFTTKMHESAIAEVYGAVNGIIKIMSEALKAGHRPSAILLQFDCMTVEHALGPKFYECQILKTYKKARETLSTFFAQFEANRPKLIFRHVKGHQGYGTARSAVNSWCDKESRKLMQEERERLSKARTLDEAQAATNVIVLIPAANAAKRAV
jgi:ribonuclease HI